MSDEQLIFVYNADSGIFSTLTDFAHKIISPTTYQCQLCALTYGTFSEKDEWKRYIQQLPIPTVFLHKDEFLLQHTSDTELPAIFLKSESELSVWLSKPEIRACKSLMELKQLVQHKYNEYVQRNHSDI